MHPTVQGDMTYHSSPDPAAPKPSYLTAPALPPRPTALGRTTATSRALPRVAYSSLSLAPSPTMPRAVEEEALEVHGILDNFRNLLLVNDAVLFEDNTIQVDLPHSFRV